MRLGKCTPWLGHLIPGNNEGTFEALPTSFEFVGKTRQGRRNVLRRHRIRLQGVGAERQRQAQSDIARASINFGHHPSKPHLTEETRRHPHRLLAEDCFQALHSRREASIWSSGHYWMLVINFCQCVSH